MRIHNKQCKKRKTLFAKLYIIYYKNEQYFTKIVKYRLYYINVYIT